MTRDVAVILSVAGVAVVLGGIIIAVTIFGVKDVNTPIILQALVAIGTIATALVAAMKATDSAEIAKETGEKTDKVLSLSQQHSAQNASIVSQASAIKKALDGQTDHACHDPLCTSNGGGK